MTGVVKSVNPKGFGFISPDEPGSDIFFHCSQLGGGLEHNEQLYGRAVAFEIEPDPNGSGRTRAINIKPLR